MKPRELRRFLTRPAKTTTKNRRDFARAQTGVELNVHTAVVHLVAASAIATEYFSSSDMAAECFTTASTQELAEF